MPRALQDVALAIKRVQSRHHRTMDAALQEVGLSLVQWDALRHVASNPEGSLHDLAQLTFQTDQAFGTLATRMVDRGLVERAAGRGRSIRLVVTARGRDLLSRGALVVDRTLAESFAPLTPAERDRVVELMEQVLAPAAGGEGGGLDVEAPSTGG